MGNFLSQNQLLANSGGGVDPRTKVIPIIAPPIADTEYWRPTDFAIPNIINDSRNTDIYGSGYMVSACCIPDKVPEKEIPCPPSCNRTTPLNFLSEGKLGESDMEEELRENFVGDIIEGNPRGCTKYCDGSAKCMCDKCRKVRFRIGPSQPGDVLTINGYNPDQLIDNNIPSNLPVGKCQLDDNLKSYNDIINTNYIQPDVFTKSEIIEPISSNIGISFTQQFEPLSVVNDCNGTTFIREDPRVIDMDAPPPPKQDQDIVRQGDVYDPRFYGYGTSYRSYIDEMTGQPRFYYDDVDAQNKYNYLCRSNIDFAKFADSTGPLEKWGPDHTKNIREKANNQFLESTLQFRTEMQERLMRKANVAAAQNRKYPKHTNFYSKVIR